MAGFSLIEVLLAISICAFAILLVVALLPIGTQVTRESMEESGAVDVVTKVTADRLATPLDRVSAIYQLPAVTKATAGVQTTTFGIKGDNSYMGADLANSRYRVEYRVTPPAGRRLDPSFVHLRVSWPAASASPSGLLEGSFTLGTP